MPVKVKDAPPEVAGHIAFRRGYQAVFDGLALTRNPHYDWSSCHGQWRQGWIEGFRVYTGVTTKTRNEQEKAAPNSP